MQADTKKLYQSYTKVHEKSKQRAAQVEQLSDEVRSLKKKISRLERERGVQESRLRMKQQSEELDELKAVVDDYKRTLKNAEDVRKNVALTQVSVAETAFVGTRACVCGWGVSMWLRAAFVDCPQNIPTGKHPSTSMWLLYCRGIPRSLAVSNLTSY